jgi:homoserine O-acetyltransferase
MSAVDLATGTMKIGELKLRGGAVLPDAEIAYATAGTLAADRGNAVLVTHGYTSSHLFIGRAGPAASEGSWARMVGPGAAIDTDRFFVVSSNMLGSSFGSTAPASTNPATGKPYGPDFPDLTVPDIVAGQRALLGAMGIDRLVAVVGPSYGGFQALTWAIEYPDALRGISMSVSGLTAPGDTTVEKLRATFAQDPNWNGGHYYDRGGISATMTRLREQTLLDYGVDESLRGRFPDQASIDAELSRQARQWAESFDANSMLALAIAMRSYDARPLLHRVKARVQFVLSRTDKLFPPSIAPAAMAAFQAAGVAAEYVEIDSAFGHHAAGTDWAKWGPDLKRFLEAL